MRILVHKTLLRAAIFAAILFGNMPFKVASAQTGTTVIHFDPPNFSNGQVVTIVSGVTFPNSPVVFSPNNVTTFSPPYALRSPQPCNDVDCTNKASQLPIQFSQDVSSVSMRVGVDDPGSVLRCFPEATTCPTYARLVGFDVNGSIVADSRDVFITDYTQQNGFFRVPIANEIRISSPAENIRSATLYVGENTLDHEFDNMPIHAQIDELTFTVPSGPKPTTPARPSITITYPQSGQSFAFPYQINLIGKVTAPGGLVAFGAFINSPVITPNDCRQLSRIQLDGSFNILISDTRRLQPTNNKLYAFAYDAFGQMGMAEIPIVLQIPPAPTIRIISPKPGESYDNRVRQVYFWGEINAPGGLAAFCPRANDSNIPPINQCTHIADVSAHGSFGIPLEASRLNLGKNTLYAFAYDQWGQTAVGSVEFNMPTDLRITAMEITQGIQTVQIPINNNGVARYSGAKLVYGGKTIVRVFVNAVAGGPFKVQEATLSAVIDQVVGNKMIPLREGLVSDNRSLKIMAGGNEPTLAERYDPNGAFVFTLPSHWTRDLNGTISITAKIGYIVDTDECSGCENNNTFTVTDINFVYQEPIRISPVEIIWTNSNGDTIRPSDPSIAFARTAAISPIAEDGLIISPYYGPIDVTDLVNNKAILASNEVRCDGTCQDRIWERVGAFEIRNLPGYTIGISRGLGIGLERPLTYIRLPLGLAWEPIAVADEGPVAIPGKDTRPISTIAHEFYHQLGYYHAGLNCTSSYSISWPPDERGLIQGIGLDRRPNSGGAVGTYRIIAPGVIGQPSEWFDLMSYCFDMNKWLPENGDYNVWISLHNWNAFGGPFPNGALPDDIFLVGFLARSQFAYMPTAMVKQTNQPTLRIVAVADPEGRDATILHVEQGSGEFVTTNFMESSYLLIARDASGREISSHMFPPLPPSSHADKAMTLGAEIISKNVAILEIQYKGQVIARRVRSTHAPEVTILSPSGADHIRGSNNVIIQWEANDADGDLLESRIEFSIDDAQTYRVLTTGVQGNRTSLPARLFTGSQRARIRLTVNDGFNDGVAVSDPFIVDGSAPQIQIIEPINGLKIYADVGLRLVGQAFDDSNQILEGERLRWFVGKDEIGTGSIVDGPKLSPGMHIVRLEATDTEGRMSSVTVNVEVLKIPSVRPTLSNWLWIGLIAVLIALIILIFIVVRRHQAQA